MPKLRIDQREVEVPPGATILEAGRQLGLEIPTLCYAEGYEPSTSCLVCVVKIRNHNRFVPSCATLAEDGMQVESETEEVHRMRRSALELLLSDHLGDCLAPCQLGCPAQMDIPLMLRQIAAGELRDAIVTVKNDIALPAVLGRICPAPCEKACRRRSADEAVAICLLKRFVADADLTAGEPYLPPRQPASGKHVAVLGAGPAGLSAAYYLLQKGHACTVFDENDRPGGRLRRETAEDVLPRDVLDAEIGTIVRLGAELRLATRIAGPGSLDDLRRRFDAVLIAWGAGGLDQAKAWGLDTASRGIEVDRDSFQTSIEGVFAAGRAIRPKAIVVRSVADGKQSAEAVDQYLSGRPVTGPPPLFTTKIGRLEADELALYVAGAGRAPRVDPAGGPRTGFTPQEAVVQAGRCMHCDCRAVHACKLREYADRYGADPRRFRGPRRAFQIDRRHAEVIYEPGKCIDCGLCIEIARAAGEPLGLTFVGRGFNVRVGAPLSGSLQEALREVARDCVEACPTAALAFNEGTVPCEFPMRNQA